jgi:hypothetical protein
VKAVLVSLDGRPLKEAIGQCLRGAFAGTPAGGRALSVWLSGALARPFLFGPVRGLRSWNETNEAAESVAREAFGIDGPWHVVLENDPSSHCVLGTAVLQATIDEIYRTATALRLDVRSTRPAWAEAIDAMPAAMAGATLLSFRDADSLTLLGMRRDEFDLASTYMPCPGADEIESLLRRLHLSRDLAPQAMHNASINTAANGAPTFAWSALAPAAA